MFKFLNNIISPVQVGDTWQMGEGKNPFKNDVNIYKVLDVQNGYVKYTVTHGECTFEDSASVAYFIMGNKLISRLEGNKE